MNLDFLFFQKLNQFAGKSICFDSLIIFFAEYLGYILIIVLLLFLLKDRKKHLAMVIQGILAAILARLGITELIRFFLPKARPFVENSVNLILDHSATSSFPSGHAAFFFALSSVIFYYNKKTGVLFFIASFLISISRVFAGIHWPSDIIAGAAVGIFSGWLVILFSRKFFSTGKTKLQQ